MIGIDSAGGYRNLAPGIHRQRLVVEGFPASVVTDTEIIAYLDELARVLEMTPILTPVVSRSDLYGWAGWTHWETSGAHFYAWETPMLFFSVDIYTCKPFDARLATEFTTTFFRASEIAAKEF